MAKTYTNLSDTINTFRSNANDLVNKVGDLASLSTTQDSDLVGAINELDSDIGARPHTTLTTTAKTLTGAVNEIDSNLGDPSSLTTTAKTIVGAINEHDAELGTINVATMKTAASTVGAAIGELSDSIGTGGLQTTAQNLVGAVNELDSDIGARPHNTLTTTAKTLTGAVLELDAELGTITSGAMGTTASTVSTAIAEIDGRVDSIDGLLDQAVKTTSAVVFSTVEATSVQAGSFRATDSSATSIFEGNVRVDGNLTAKGTVNLINSNQVDIGDNILLLNGDVTGSPSEDAGLEVERGTSNNAIMQWDETGNYWKASYVDAGTAARIVTAGDTSIVTNAMLAGSITNAKLSNSSITFTDSATSSAISLGGSLKIKGTSSEVTVGYSGGVFTIGLPDDVTVANNLEVVGDLITSGDFQINGNQLLTTNFVTLVDSNLSAGIPASFGKVAGLKVDRGSLTNVYFAFDDSSDVWVYYDSGQTGFNRKVVLSTGNLSASSPIVVTDTLTGTTISASDASTSSKGVASFDSASFSTSSGAVSIKSAGVSNAQLANSAITINGTSTALGGTRTLVTDDIAEEGSPVNQWFTNARARASVSATNSGTGYGSLSYASGTGVITYTKVTDANIRGAISATNTASKLGSISYSSSTGVITYTGPDSAQVTGLFTASNQGTGYGSLAYSNGEYTYTKVTSANIRGNISATNTASKLGSISYNNSTGVITYTGPDSSQVIGLFSASNQGTGYGSLAFSGGEYTYTKVTDANIRGALSVTAGTGLSYNSGTGAFSGVDATTSVKGVASFNNASFSTSSGAVSIKSAGVSNAQLANSSITINGSAVSLGGSVTISTTDSIGGLTNGFYDSSEQILAIGRAASTISTTFDSDTVAIGPNALATAAISPGRGYNTVIGAGANQYADRGSQNVYLGAFAGNMNKKGATNVGIGFLAMGKLLASASDPTDQFHQYNTAIGGSTLSSIHLASHYIEKNVAIGPDALKRCGTGASTGTEGRGNTVVGAFAADNITTGFNNTVVGAAAATANTTGSNNTLIGYNAEPSSATVSNEITLGDASVTRFRIPGRLVDVTGNANAANGLVVKNASNRIASDLEIAQYMYHEGDTDTYVSMTTDAVAVVAGGVTMLNMVEGVTDYVDIIDRVRVTAAGDLECEGDIIAYTATAISDINQKENIQKIPFALDKVNQLNGVTFSWKESKDVSAGIIAQDVEKVLPQIVKEKTIRDGDPIKTVNYDGLVGLLIEAVKELSGQVEELKKKLGDD